MADIDELSEGPRIGPVSVQRGQNNTTPTETLIDDVLAGRELHDALMRLAYRGLSEAELRSHMEQSAARTERPHEWEERYDDIPRLVATAREKRTEDAERAFGEAPPAVGGNQPAATGGNQPVATAPGAVELPLMLPGDFKSRPLVEREWIVPDLIPRYEPTLLFGVGATGKSLLLLQLCIAMAAGRKWLDCDVPPGRAMMFTCEDSTDEINRRARAVLKAMELEWDDLGDRLAIIPMRDSDTDAVLATEQGGMLSTTPSYDALKGAVKTFVPDLLVIDTLADAFAGDENQRAQAKQFVARISRLGKKVSPIVTAHPSVSGMESGRGSSGSTGWPAAVRSHLFFGRLKDGEDPDVRTLTSLKANYAQEGAGGIEVRWESGAFKALSRMDRIRQGADAEALFLELLRVWTAAGNHVNATGGVTYAPSVFADTSQAKAARLTKKHLKDAMARLIGSGRIETATRMSNRREVSYLRIKTDG